MPEPPGDWGACSVAEAIATMKQHPSDADVQKWGCGALWHLADDDSENKKAIAAAGGIEAVVAAMKQHPPAEYVQVDGCSALEILAQDNAENKKAIAAAGGIEAVLAAMEQHPSAADVQVDGCGALWNLAENNAENKKAIAAAGGVEAVVAAMTQHPSAATLQSIGCGALRNLALDVENQNAISAAGGIEAVVAAMKQHPSIADVQEQGCDTLWNLALNNAENRKAIGAAGGIEAVVAAMKQHPSDADLQGYGCGALLNLASNNAENVQAIGAAGGIEAVAAAMKQCPSVADIQLNGQCILDAIPAVPQQQPSKVQTLCDMGFLDKSKNEQALKQTGGNVEDAVEVLISANSSSSGGGSNSGGGSASSVVPPPSPAAATPASPVTPAAGPAHAAAALTFATSNFKRFYNAAPVPAEYMDLLIDLNDLLKAHCAANGFNPGDGNKFHMALLKEATAAADSVAQMLAQVPAAAQRMWTSTQKFQNKTELCSIINAAIRSDNEALVSPAAKLARGINQLCIARRMEETAAVKFPPNGSTFRGGLLPATHLAFYAVGKQYRVPGYLATSFNEKVAKGFARRAWQAKKNAGTEMPAVVWVVQVDPAGENDEEELCQNANYIANTLVPGEDEYLFVPYSVFTVTKVEVSPTPNYKTPHRIYIRAASDSLMEPEDLPLAPWY